MKIFYLISVNFPSLYNRRLREIVILMYKVRNSLAPDYIGELFNFANKGYSLINADFDIENTLLATWAHNFGPVILK